MTPRGSGTNGYVQRNLSAVRRSRPQQRQPLDHFDGAPSAIPTAITKDPDQGILQHYKRREIELKCAELEDELLEQGIPEDDIEERVVMLRQELLQKQESSLDKPSKYVARTIFAC